MDGAGRWLLGLLGLALATGAQTPDALDPGRGRVAVVAATYAGPWRDLGSRYGQRLARAVERTGRGLTALDPAGVAAALGRLPASDREPLDAALAGDLDAVSAVTLRQCLGAESLVLSGLTNDGTLAVSELWDLRSPVRLGRWSATGGSGSDLLAEADGVGAALAGVIPVVARVSRPAERLVDDRIELDQGGRQGLPGSGRVLLLSDLGRGSWGAWSQVVGVARLLSVAPRTAKAQIESLLPGVFLRQVRYAVAPRLLPGGAPLTGWLDPWRVGQVNTGTGPAAQICYNGGLQLLARADATVVVRVGDRRQTVFLVAGLASLLPGVTGPAVLDQPGGAVTVAPPATGGVTGELKLWLDRTPAVYRRGEPWTVDSPPLPGPAELRLVAPNGEETVLVTSPAAAGGVRYHGLATGRAGDYRLILRWSTATTNNLAETQFRVVGP